MRPFTLANIFLISSLLVIDALYLLGIVDWWWLLVPIFFYINLLVLGAIYIQWNFYLKSYNKGGDKKQIALTFDDGPTPATATILDILNANNVPATFFSIGKNADKYPDVVIRWHNEGHLIGNHSYEHGFNFDWKSAKAMGEEINKTNLSIQRITGQLPMLFRPPYGVTNPNLAKAVKASGMFSIGWSIRSFDTRAKDAQSLLQKILDDLEGGDIILLHDAMPITAQILTDLIIKAREKGFTFVRVDELLGLQAYA